MSMSLSTLESIEDAINLIKTKKQDLKEAFENLHTQSPSIPLLNFTWSELDSYLTSFEKHLVRSFSELQPRTLNPESERSNKDALLPDSVPARPELKAICEKNDGLGLRSYVFERPKERYDIIVEMVDAFRHAPDLGSMVLDALNGFWENNLDSKLRNVSVKLLEEFMRAGLDIGAECKSRALSLAVEWKGKISNSKAVGEKRDDTDGDEWGVERLAFLQLLGAFKLLNDDRVCSRDELINNIVEVGKSQRAVDLCWKLGIENNVLDVVKRLIGKGERLLAIKFIFEFKLTDEFPPVLLLTEYLMESKKNAQQIRKKGKNSAQSLKDAATKEISDLKAAIKCIDDHNLESEYPKKELLTRLEKLEKEKADLASVPKNKKPAKQAMQNGNKRMKPNAAGSSSARYRQNVLPIHATPYHGGAHGPVVFVPQAGLDQYGFSRAHLGFPGNTTQSFPSLYRHAQPPFYDVYYP